METPAEIANRWRYLRDLLIEQLDRFERGALKLHAGDADVSAGAIGLLKQHIIDFDTLIARSDAREAKARLQEENGMDQPTGSPPPKPGDGR